MLRRLSLIALVALSLGLSGCVVVTDDPGDFSVSGSWTVDGFVPTYDDCVAANVDVVEIYFYQGGTSIVTDILAFDCEQGSFYTDRMFPWGDYDTEWRAVGFDGAVSVGDRLALTVYAPVDHAELAPVNFAK